jgi:hypothetical protein
LTPREVTNRFVELAAPVRIAFYSGHGKATPAATGGVTFTAREEAGVPPLTARGLLTAMDDRPGGSISVLLLNTCDSGYVDLRGVTRPTVVLGSGYGEITAQGESRRPQTAFGGALAGALAGGADLLPFGNCDGVVTDDEVHQYLNNALHDIAAADDLAWRIRPLAVLKRNVDFHLPVAWPGIQPQCAGQDRRRTLDAFVDELRRRVSNARDGMVIQALHEAVESYFTPLTGAVPAPTGPRRFLLVSSGARGAAVLLDELRQLADARVGWPLVEVAGESEQALARGALAASYLDIVLLRIRDSAFGGLYLELVRMRDGLVTWAHVASESMRREEARTLATKIEARLPQAVGLVRVGDSTGLTSVVLRTTGPGLAPGSAVIQRRRWRDIVATKMDGTESVPLHDLSTAPCPGGLGQCFLMDHVEEDEGQWVFTY